MSTLCKCGTVREKQVSGPNAQFPNRPYFLCSSCNAFDWADQAGHFAAEAGPVCRCGKATVQRAVKKEGANKGRKFWSCASWPNGCGFFEYQASPQIQRPMAASSSPQRPPLPGFASYVSDWAEQQSLQQMIDCDPKLLGYGADHSGSTDYDKLELVGSWRITNGQREQSYQAAMQRLASNPVPASETLQLPEGYAAASGRLGGAPLNSLVGEVRLLHGTEPRHLHSILFGGLDPHIAANGMFGRGTYFAENAGKNDQYTAEDVKFQKEGELAELHEKLYKGQQQHSERVRYIVVCRVALGRTVRTMDGHTQLSSASTPLFTDDTRSYLAKRVDGVAPNSLVAETGGRVQRFREFVVFQPDQIMVEYLVAYKRKRALCDCGLPVAERTVVNGDNRGRACAFCPKDRDDATNCKFVRVFPLCLCNRSAQMKTTRSGKNAGKRYYSCPKTRGWCDWFGGWVPDGVGGGASFGSPSKRPRY